MIARSRWWVGLAGMIWLGLSSNSGHGQQKKVILQGADAVRHMISRGEYAKAEQYAYQTLFPDIHQPEVLDLLSRILEVQKKREQSAVMSTWLLRVLEQAKPADVAKYKSATEKRLALLNQDFERLKTKYAAAGVKPFTAPDQVDDLWMTQVKADLTSPHALYAYDLVGGRKYSEPEHVAIASRGVMHRSGLRWVDQVAARQGVLFGVPMRADGANLAKQKRKHPPQVHMTGKGSVLRVGTKGFGFPYLLKVQVGGKEVLSQTISEKQWSDLKIGLGDQADKTVDVTLELIVPDGQKYSEGAWIDYLDFFTS